MGFFDQLFDSVKAAAESLTEMAAEKTAEKPTQPDVPTVPQKEMIRFGSPNPVPYTQEINGVDATLYVRYHGKVEVDVIDSAIVQNYGGIEKVKNDLIKEICVITDDLVQRCSSLEHCPVYRLSSRTSDFAGFVMKQARDSSWHEIYGVELICISYESILLTKESQEVYDKLKKAQLEQANTQQPAQPQTSAAPAAWKCPYCGSQNSGKFCTNCGAKQGQ